jgi:hypothetical protein
LSVRLGVDDPGASTARSDPSGVTVTFVRCGGNQVTAFLWPFTADEVSIDIAARQVPAKFYRSVAQFSAATATPVQLGGRLTPGSRF